MTRNMMALMAAGLLAAIPESAYAERRAEHCRRVHGRAPYDEDEAKRYREERMKRKSENFNKRNGTNCIPPNPEVNGPPSGGSIAPTC